MSLSKIKYIKEMNNVELTILENLYFNNEIDRNIFLKYYHLNSKNNLYTTLIKDGIITDKQKDLSENISQNILKSLKPQQLKKLNKEKEIELILIENILYKLRINSFEEYSEHSKNEPKYKEVRIIFIKEDYFKTYYKEKTRNIKKIENLQGRDVPSMVNYILDKAIDNKVTDIHLNTKKNKIQVKYRTNGELKTYIELEKTISNEVFTRIKIMANLDITIKNDIQDGELIYLYNNIQYNIRLSTMPTIYGEKIALRILENENNIIELGNLEFKEDIGKINSLINLSDGLILIVGPTGCGKTTTLYSMLKEMDSEKNNILTVENPVELKINNISQIQINEKMDLTFSKILKSILRQDPNIIMLGEIRDKETGIEAARAAITGHLILSTLHTSRAIDAIDRLIDIGVEPYMVASSLRGVISQRLVKVLCPKCKEKYKVKNYEKKLLGLEEVEYLYRKKGCNNCLGGFIGRKAIFEVLLIDDKMKNKIRTLTYENIDLRNFKNLKDRYREEIIVGNIELNEIYDLGDIKYGE